MQYSFIKNVVLARSTNQQQFFHSLRMMGLSIEYKNGIAIGIRDGSKLVKWSKMNIKPEDFAALRQRGEMHSIKQRLDRLENPKQIQNRKLDY